MPVSSTLALLSQDKMKREEQVVLIVDESRIDCVLHESGLAANLRAQVHKLHRLARLVFSLVGDPAGLGLPHPRSRKFERSFRVEVVADRLDLVPRIETVSLGNLLEPDRVLEQ